MNVEHLDLQEENPFSFDAFMSPCYNHMMQFKAHTIARILVSFIPMASILFKCRLFPQSIYSFGAGSCSHEAFLSCIYKDTNINCFDISSKYIPVYTKKLINNNPKFRFNEISFEKLDWSDFSQMADFVFTIQTLEHIKETETTLDNLSSTVKPGGYIYIDAPYFSEIENQEDPIFLKAEKLRQWQKNSHYHLGFSLKRMRERLKERGFTIIESGYSSYMRAESALLNLIRSNECFKNKNADYPLVSGLSNLYHTMLEHSEAYCGGESALDSLKIKERKALAFRILAQRNN